MTVRHALAALAALGGLLALWTPRASTLDVSALELATWIRDRKPGLRIIDLREPAQFNEYHLPRAENVAIEQLTFTPSERVVLVTDGGALPHLDRQVFVLRGGMQAWLDDVMSPTTPEAVAIGRYFGGVPRVWVPASAGTGRLKPAPTQRRHGC
jgi:rhodanese-related sulfurtransferase